MSTPLLHVVLHQPEIPQNTGNIGRTCVAVGAKLWLIRPLGFRLDEKHLRRAGMDYWPHLDYEVVDSWQELREKLPSESTIWLVENAGGRMTWDAEYQRGDVLVFGCEGRGLPQSIIDEYRDHVVELPMTELVRSLNLASTVNTAVYEAVRQFGGIDL
ncbi:MAG: tRNA (cytidine(34)-2'-O)-methyltransferase [Planctomycetaceae bacterium]|jgi:tRNA (cytidine/uridine-2'-O-)-methyltransferase|nr:tRNA (cytidine(34)-2'-O)-methyltransferase [Planctomycetaceae bacterium]